jgi:uncharacterized protein (DUF608 family)
MPHPTNPGSPIRRREFLKQSAVSVGLLGAASADGATAFAQPTSSKKRTARSAPRWHAGAELNRIAFPMGGLGAGMICLEGTGALSHVSLRNRPEVFHEPVLFAALGFKDRPRQARVLEGPVPAWKLFGNPGTGNGAAGTCFGLPRFRQARFSWRFPFGTVELQDPKVPVTVQITGWSPFVPLDADRSSLPVAGLEYRLHNVSRQPVELVFSFNARNFLASSRGSQAIRSIPQGFVLWGSGAKDAPWEETAFAAAVDSDRAQVNHAWFRGGWWDPLTMAWKDVTEAACYRRDPIQEGAPAPGATVFVPLRLEPGSAETVVVRLAWYAGRTNLRIGKDLARTAPAAGQTAPTYQPWYAGRFSGIDELSQHWRVRYAELRRQSAQFSQCLYDTTLPPVVMEAVAANLTILKSPTVLRQSDGRLWAWEGCSDNAGCCHGSCTHVWNYAQAIPHLFPDLERSLRETEFGPSQSDRGHQTFRSAIPIRPVEPDFHAAADGQLGGIMKAHREWRISGDTEWLRRLWPKIKRSLDYCVETWDPERRGWLEEPHHNTYDIEFWGPDGMCTSFYLGALQAAIRMGTALGEEVADYVRLLAQGRRLMETELYDGEYFIQRITWEGLHAKNPVETKSMVGDYSPEAVALLQKEGPKYQYGSGCLADGVLGCWLATVCGVDEVVDSAKVASHLRAVHRHNLRRDLSEHANPQRPSYACGAEGGLLLCTWPKGGALSLPFVYSNEVWTGIEYQVASHLILMGQVKEGVEIVAECRARYDGRIRNPFNEYECGHWYARAMSSYALLQSFTRARYDAVTQTLHLAPTVAGDCRAFLCTARGYGSVGVRHGKPFLEVVQGEIPVREIVYQPASRRGPTAG